MTAIFRTVLEMSLTGTWVILAVILARLLLKKAPKRCSYALWAVAGFRLCCPVSFESVFSLFRIPNVHPGAVVTQSRMPVAEPVIFGTSQSTSAAQAVTPAVTDTAPAAGPDWLQILAAVWLVGMGALLLYSIVCDVRLRLRMRTAIRLRDRIWQSEDVRSPFILGFVRPRIFLPCGLDAQQESYVLAHERCHLRRGDHLIKLAAFLILAVHWFNPLCHVAFRLLCRDMEMSCDEKVLASRADRKNYSATLVSIAADRRMPMPSPLAFGETAVKARVKNILRWKKAKTWTVVLALALCALVILACAADPVETFELRKGKYIIANGETGEDYVTTGIVEFRDDRLILFDEIYDLSDKQWETPPFDQARWEEMLQNLEGAAPEKIGDCQYMELFVLSDKTLDEYLSNVRQGIVVWQEGVRMNDAIQTFFLLRQGSSLYVCRFHQPNYPSVPESLSSDRLVEPGSKLDPTVQIYGELDGLVEQVLAQPGANAAEKAAADEDLYWTILRSRHIRYYLCHVMATEGLAGEKGELMGILFEDVLMRRFEDPLIQRGDMTAAQYFEAYMAYALEYYSGQSRYMISKNASGPMLYYLQTHYDYGK